MSDLSATNCGCGCESGMSNWGGCNNSCLWIILILLFCGCGENGFGNFGNCGCGCENGMDNCWIIIIILLFCCCGNNSNCGCGGCDSKC